MKKVASFLIVFSMVLSMLVGCSSTKKSDGDAENTTAQTGAKTTSYVNLDSEFPIVKNQITMKVATIKQSGGGSTDKLWFWKWAEKNTNIKYDVTQVESSAWNEKKNIMFASQELPDFFLNCDFNADEILRFGQIEKQFMPMNDLIEKYAPNIKTAFTKEPDVKAKVTCPDGNIYNLPSMGAENITGYRPFINGAWLQNLGLKAPETLDDLYDVLKAFKEKDPNKNGKADEIPFSGSWNPNADERMIVLTALGFNSNNQMSLCIKDNKVVLPEADPLYAEYLKYMNQLFKDGLLDKDVFTQTQVQARAKSTQNIVGLALDGSTQIISPDKWKDYIAFKPVTSKWNSTRMWPAAETSGLSKFMIGANSKYPEAAIRFADMYFNEKNNVLLWYGPRKDSTDNLGYEGWYVENNQVVYKYPEGVKTGWDYRIGYMNPINGNKLGYFPLLDHFEKLYNVKITYDEPSTYFRKELEEKVQPYYKTSFPSVYLKPEQVEKRNALYTPISDYCKMMEAKFITGAEPLTNIDKYLGELKKMGVDDYLKIYQEAYDSYQKNLKK